MVAQVVQRVLGRDVHGQAETIAWSIVIASKGLEGFVDELLDSREYLDHFGYDTVPYQRRRVLPGRDLGEAPFNIKSPRYDAYWRGIIGFPKAIYAGAFVPKRLPARSKVERGGSPAAYKDWVADIVVTRAVAGGSSNTEFDFMAKVPYRKV